MADALGTVVGALSALAVAGALFGAAPAVAQQGYGYGPGMMGPGMMGWGYQQPRDLNLSANDVKTRLERSLAVSGNVRVKVGPVKEQDANIVVADIATVDRGVLVERYQVDRHTGSWQPLR